MRGMLPASGSPLGFPLVTSKNSTNSWRRERALVFIALSFGLSAAIVWRAGRAFMIVPDGEAPLVLQAQRPRQVGRQHAQDLSNLGFDPMALASHLGVGDVMLEAAQQRAK